MNEWMSVSVAGLKIEPIGDKKPKEYTFTKNIRSKLNLLPDVEPMDYFSLFFNDKILNNTVTKTKRYARDKIAKLQLRLGSIWNKWSEVCITKIKASLGLIINTGIILLPDIEDYQSCKWTTQNVLVTECLQIAFNRYFGWCMVEMIPLKKERGPPKDQSSMWSDSTEKHRTLKTYLYRRKVSDAFSAR